MARAPAATAMASNFFISFLMVSRPFAGLYCQAASQRSVPPGTWGRRAARIRFPVCRQVCCQVLPAPLVRQCLGRTNFGADEGVRGEYSRIGAEPAVMR